MGRRRHHGRLGTHHRPLGLLLLQAVSRRVQLRLANRPYDGVQTGVVRCGECFRLLQHLRRFHAPAHADAIALDATYESSEEDWRIRRLCQRSHVSSTHPACVFVLEVFSLINDRISAIAIVRQYILYTSPDAADPTWDIIQIKIWM